MSTNDHGQHSDRALRALHFVLKFIDEGRRIELARLNNVYKQVQDHCCRGLCRYLFHRWAQAARIEPPDLVSSSDDEMDDEMDDGVDHEIDDQMDRWAQAAGVVLPYQTSSAVGWRVGDLGTGHIHMTRWMTSWRLGHWLGTFR